MALGSMPWTSAGLMSAGNGTTNDSSWKVLTAWMAHARLGSTHWSDLARVSFTPLSIPETAPWFSGSSIMAATLMASAALRSSCFNEDLTEKWCTAPAITESTPKVSKSFEMMYNLSLEPTANCLNFSCTSLLSASFRSLMQMRTISRTSLLLLAPDGIQACGMVLSFS